MDPTAAAIIIAQELRRPEPASFGPPLQISAEINGISRTVRMQVPSANTDSRANRFPTIGSMRSSEAVCYERPPKSG